MEVFTPAMRLVFCTAAMTTMKNATIHTLALVKPAKA